MNQFSPSVFIFLLKVDSGYLLLLVDCALMPQSRGRRRLQQESVSWCDPTESKANEEAHGPPAESVRQKRKSARFASIESSLMGKGTALFKWTDFTDIGSCLSFFLISRSAFNWIDRVFF